MPNSDFRLSSSELGALLRPVIGEGGFQILLRKLQQQVDPRTRILRIASDDHEKMIRYKAEYGPGGFQGRIPERYWRRVTDSYR